MTTPRLLVRVALVLSLAAAPYALLDFFQGAVQAQGAAQAPAASQSAPRGPARPAPSWADQILQQETYATPPPELASAVLAPRHLNVTLGGLSPDKKWFLREVSDGPVVMAKFSRPFDELGGLFLDASANRTRALTYRTNVAIELISPADGSRKPIPLPPGTRVTGATWSPDGSAIAYYVHGADATHIWLADVATMKSRQITRTPVLATLVTGIEFTNGGKQIAAVLVPDGRRPRPAQPQAPGGPEVSLAEDGDKNRLRTFPSLMKTPYDFELLEWHATGQYAVIDVATLAVKKVGAPAMIRSIDPSPDGQFARVTVMTKPFSYIVPVSSFGQKEEVWDSTGKSLVELSSRPINLGVQPATADPQAAPGAGGGRGGGGAQNGKRELAWRPDGQGFTYLEQEPAPAPARGGNAAANDDAAAPARGGGGRGGGRQGGGQAGPARPDRVYQWLAPFTDATKKVIYESQTRMTGHRFSEDMSMLFYRETANQQTIDYAIDLAAPADKHVLVRYRTDDFYANPGTLMGAGGAGGGGGGGGRGGGGGGGAVLLSADKANVFYSGTVYDKTPDKVGPKTFIDQVAIKTGEKQRIFESNNVDTFERVSSVLDINAKRFVLSVEGPTKQPQQYLLENGNRKQLTNNEDMHPDLTNAPRERFVVERADGFKFRVVVNLPPGYQKGTKLPALFWFYPSEFTTQEAYDSPDRSFNKNAFQNFGSRSMEYFVRLGYAVVEPDTPIVGPDGMMNNNYVNDLRNDLSATIDELDRRALVDRTRLAIGGHSYGAFSTVNAMVNTPFFKAGIAGDGAYNRTLTPLGFQTERRDLWTAPNVYLGMSPFLAANNLTGALLMYHGMHDQNVGTDPDNSIRLFHALNGLGKTTALYMYPLEDHGPITQETLLDLWARWGAWLDKYVKNPHKPDNNKPAPAAGGGGGR
jgi:dipeptidyl aminopeptidase/acylaminoacyl peptidase